MKEYEYLIVGSGLFGSAFANRANRRGKRCLVIDKRPHLGGNIYCKSMEGINVHKYGAHIFHTSNREVWNFVNSITEMNRFVNSPLVFHKGKLYNLPFNMNTFYQLWGITTPQEARKKIEKQRHEAGITHPQNLEEQAISLVGREIYEILVKGYTEKQWGRACSDLPAFIIQRLPLRFTFDNNYFNDTYQGIPIGGYNKLIDGLLQGIETRCNADYFKDRDYFDKIANKMVYTGSIDEFYNYRFGKLEYRTLKFETEILNSNNFQGNAVVNYTEKEIPYTRIIEHKHFEFGTQPQTVITREYPSEYNDRSEPFYPINDTKNNALYQQYSDLARNDERIIFGGRLAEYKYHDMDKIVEQILKLEQNEKI